MAELAEHETLILANEADLAAGFFSFYTTRPAMFRRLCKRIGGQAKLVGLRVGMRGGRPASWDCQVPADFWGGSRLGIRAKAKARKAARTAASTPEVSPSRDSTR